MPFIAHLQGRRVNALELSANQWLELKASDAYVSMVFPGCGVRAVAKTSSRGRRFFAHHTTAGCDEPHLNETAQHRLMKEAIAQLITSQSGWRGLVEYPGPHREWVADVLAVSDAGRRIAFEVQLTQQSDADFEQRSQVRFDAGALPVWVTPHQPATFPRLPLIGTKFRKSTPLPASSHELLEEVTLSARGRMVSLEMQILSCLRADRPWTYGDPRQQREQKARAEQQAKEREAKRQRQAAQEERERQQRAAQFVRSAFNPQSVHPKISFPRNNGQALWTTGVHCQRCDQAYYVWSAQDPETFRRVYEPHPARAEDRAEVKGAITRWHTGLYKPYPLAALGRAASQRYKVRVPTYFACPSCRLISDRYLHLIPSDTWLLLPGFSSAPTPRLEFEEMVARAQLRAQARARTRQDSMDSLGQ